MTNDLFSNIEKINMTQVCISRIKRNLELDVDDVVLWCKEVIRNPESISRTQKSWNVRGDGFVILIDPSSYMVITARKEKRKKGSDLTDVNIIKKLDDEPLLKVKLVEIFNTKTHRNVSKFGLLLADHILSVVKMPTNDNIKACYSVIERWQNGYARFQEARDVAFLFHEMARDEKDIVREKVLRTLGQIAAIPHVKRHALIATDYAVKVINLLYPGNMAEVRKEREVHIKLMENV